MACLIHLFLPNIVFMITLPIFRSIPARVVGMPVVLAISRFTLSIPNRRLHEKETPGILKFDFIVVIQLYDTLQILYYRLRVEREGMLILSPNQQECLTCELVLSQIL